MLKECSNCKAKIPFLDFYKNYLIGNRYKYTCTKCGAVHKAKISSILIFSAIFFVINMYLIFNKCHFGDIIYCSGWAVIIEIWIKN